ncbi:MAG: hypothetical protein FWE03_02010 [Firmicutes bacterium]|nr:hypothetical protein [Bacillota bacterium]
MKKLTTIFLLLVLSVSVFAFVGCGDGRNYSGTFVLTYINWTGEISNRDEIAMEEFTLVLTQNQFTQNGRIDAMRTQQGITLLTSTQTFTYSFETYVPEEWSETSQRRIRLDGVPSTFIMLSSFNRIMQEFIFDDDNSLQLIFYREE